MKEKNRVYIYIREMTLPHEMCPGQVCVKYEMILEQNGL